MKDKREVYEGLEGGLWRIRGRVMKNKRESYEG